MMKYFLNLFIFLNLALLTFQSPAKISDLEDSRMAIWEISNGLQKKGTAFFISPNRAVTNFHVIKGVLQNNSLKNMRLTHNEMTDLNRIKKVLRLSPTHDLAIFETTNDNPVHLNLSDQSTYLPDEKWKVLGYLWGNLRSFKKTGPFFKGLFHSFPAPGFDVRGISGSPVLNQDEEVLGVITTARANFKHFVPSSHLKDFRNGLTGISCQNIEVKACIHQAFLSLHLKASQGDFQSQYNLSLFFDRSETRWEKHEEVSKYPELQTSLYVYRDPDISEEKFYELLQGLKLASNKGYPIAQYHLANHYAEKKEEEEAVLWMKRSSEGGFAPAQFMIGLYYIHQKDTEKALAEIISSAEMEYFYAQQFLTKYYLENQKIEESIFWAQKLIADNPDTSEEFIYSLISVLSQMETPKTKGYIDTLLRNLYVADSSFGQ